MADHWLMVWQENVRVIAMLTNLTEGGKVRPQYGTTNLCKVISHNVLRKHIHGHLVKKVNYFILKKKCEQYWPDFKQEVTYGDITVLLQQENKYAYYVTRQLKLRHKSVRNFCLNSSETVLLNLVGFFK